MASIFSTAWIGDGFGWANCTDTPDAGHFCKTAGSKPQCRAGCYCPGGNKTAVGTSINVDNSCEKKKNESDLIRSGIFFCPSGFPLSLEGASQIEDCYFTSSEGKKVTITGYMVDVPPGQYLPKNSVTPQNCPTDENSRFCPGGKMTPYHDERVGVRTCPTSGKVSDDFKKCLISCKAGEYLYLARNTNESINDTKCKTCPEGKVCEGVTDYEYKGIKDRMAEPVGITTCATGEKPNDDQTACVSPNGQGSSGSTTTNSAITIDAGFYLRANNTEPTQCTGTNKFCPGGSFYKKSVEQGRFDCPSNTRANDDHSACELKFTKSQMLNGASGNAKCWLKTDIEDYKACVYGKRTDTTQAVKSTGKLNLKPIDFLGIGDINKNNKKTSGH